SGSGATVSPSRGSFVLSGAEDDRLGSSVTGVQTCALPIWGDLWSGQGATFNNTGTFDVAGDASFLNNLGGPATINNTGSFQKSRSEERRVGKERGNRDGRDQSKSETER